MTGEQVYALWCDGVRGMWKEDDGNIFTALRPNQPARKPVAHAFLTPAERAGWDTVARIFNVAQDGPDVSLLGATQ